MGGGEKQLIYQFLDKILNKNLNIYKPLLKIAFSDFNECKFILDKLSIHRNLNIRADFMLYLVKNHFDKISCFYDSIEKYFSYFDGTNLEYMQSKFVSRLAILFLTNGNQEAYVKIKEFLFQNYQENELAFLLLEINNPNLEKEFLNDCNRLFETSSRYQFEIYKSYSNYLSKEVLEWFIHFIHYFKNEQLYLANYEYYDVEYIIKNGLGRKLQEYIDKYLSLSKRDDYEFVRSGTTTACYRIGDYAFKLCQSKWSYEKVISPNLYIFQKI